MNYDGVLLIAFGGPTPGGCNRIQADGEACPGPEHGNPCPEGSPTEAHCFVQGILGKAPERASRVNEVAHHYHDIGGFSPFNEHTFRQGRKLAAALRARKLNLPVEVGLRHWGPSLRDVAKRLSEAGHRRMIGIIMAPHQSKVSWDWYITTVNQAVEELAADKRIAFTVLDPWWKHPGFTGAVADIIRGDAKAWGEARFGEAEMIFSAHSIPMAISKSGPYVPQFEETAALVAKDLGRAKWSTAFQSSASDATQPWTGPDINDAIRAAKAKGAKDVIVSPIGFLVDHVEVLYDLDIEAKQTAAECGVGFIRSGTVGGHPKFIGMLADLVAERAAR
ncbi:MAG: ferrochelatase [Planctomycetes bacterium]|nr:ferrochelatase [Planctomycetota bacterium]